MTMLHNAIGPWIYLSNALGNRLPVKDPKCSSCFPYRVLKGYEKTPKKKRRRENAKSSSKMLCTTGKSNPRWVFGEGESG
jgi:hypothetical protein